MSNLVLKCIYFIIGLLKDIPALTKILLFHVVSGVQKPNRNGRTYETLLVEDSIPKELSVKVTVDTTESFIWGGQETPAKVVTMNIACDNGVIHVIDEVLIPYEGSVAPQHN